MEKKKKGVNPASFDWLGLFGLIIGIDGLISVLADLRISSLLILYSLCLICLVVLIACSRHYNWKNALVATMFIIGHHPVRFIFAWWLNPIIYALVILGCLYLCLHTIKRYGGKNTFAILLLVCTLIVSWQTVASGIEVGHCHVEDIRWNYQFICKPTSTVYQQILDLPIGMNGFCYYCPWSG